MRAWIYAGTLLLGVMIGTVMVGTTDRIARRPIDSDDSAEAVYRKSARAPESVAVRIGRMISAETPTMNEDMPLNKATDVLFSERKSPMRTRAFLKSRIQMMTSDQLVQSMVNGEIQTKAEIEEATRRLATEDPEGTFNHWESDFRLYGMDNIYAFADTLLQTWADADAPAVLKRLQKMKRGGSQFDRSTRFSNYWAKIDPAAAASHFNDLVYLRSMSDKGKVGSTDQAYAEAIVRSWKQKDEAAMREYIEKLPDGQEREAFEEALKKLDAPK